MLEFLDIDLSLYNIIKIASRLWLWRIYRERNPLFRILIVLTHVRINLIYIYRVRVNWILIHGIRIKIDMLLKYFRFGINFWYFL